MRRSRRRHVSRHAVRGTVPRMSEEESFKGRVTRQGEEAIGKLAQELLENPMVSSALSAAFETRERAMRAQQAAMGALNLPSASDLERLTRRIRSVSQRLESIEDGLDRLDDRLERVNSTKAVEDRLRTIEAVLTRLEDAESARAARLAHDAESAGDGAPAPASSDAAAPAATPAD
jgi:chromosome segregation ATPase